MQLSTILLTRAVRAMCIAGVIGSADRNIMAAPATEPSPGKLARYAEPPPSGSYPSSARQIQSWIDRLGEARMRGHAWDIWASITSPADKEGTPVWETWYSGHEIFDLGVTNRPANRHAFRDFELPAQHLHHGRNGHIPIDSNERVLSFNRYSPTVAHYIWEQGYNRSNVLDRINREFDRKRTPVGARAISTSRGIVDAKSIVLKPVFQFISGTKPTAVPYWAGISPNTTTNMANPTAASWRQCVVVDPTGQHPPGSTFEIAFNAEPKSSRPVVSIEDFYHIQLSQADAEAFSQFAFTSGDDVGKKNLTDTNSLKAVVKEGNIALLVAMHVTTKEITNWTWQTFWWARYPAQPPFGHDRPGKIKGPWSHYAMRTAYYMVTPVANPPGEPLFSFNPYLETNLEGIVTNVAGVNVQWTGPDSNCMSCHRMAAFGHRQSPMPLDPQYIPSGFISPDDPQLFSGFTKLDFLWSLTRAAP